VGVIHRDLKPENILLTKQGGLSDFPKVLDFGLAKIRETKPRPGSMVLTREGMVFGTPEFMSPEQAQGEILDSRSDIYSLALIFYELVTGKLPFPKCRPMEYISHHINTDPIPITDRTPTVNLPDKLNPIIAKALEKDRDKRYQSAREFADALKTILPRSAMSGAIRALPQEKKTSKAPDKPKVPSKSPPPAAVGKGMLLALLAVIILLLVLVIWLFATRDTIPQAATIPANPQGRPPGSPAAVGSPPPSAPE
jgi:serine/threonine protein kinase